MAKSIIMLAIWFIFIFLSYKFVKLNIKETQRRLKEDENK